MFLSPFAPDVALGKVTAVVGGQFGSEAKGLVAGYLASKFNYLRQIKHSDISPSSVACVTNAGAQAGHTTIMHPTSAKKMVCYHLPTAGVFIKDSFIYLSAGSIIDPDAFYDELNKAEEFDPNIRQRVHVDPGAAIIDYRHRAYEMNFESGAAKIGSTQKGVGSALVDKIRRLGNIVGLNTEMFCEKTKLSPNAIYRVPLAERLLKKECAVILEVPQGTSLSINSSGMYPHTTSREAWLMQGMTDAGIPSCVPADCWMVVRTYPIRVGNITNQHGEVTGWSGPFFPDSRELSWEDHFPGITPERTTVTNRVRRIASWSHEQYMQSFALNQPKVVVVTFCNYLRTLEDWLKIAQSMKKAHDHFGAKPQIYYSFNPYSYFVTDTPPFGISVNGNE